MISVNLILPLLIIVSSISQGYASYEYYYYKDISPELVKILKKPNIERIQIYRCNYEIQRKFYHCNPYSNKLIRIEYDPQSQLIDIDRDSCLTIHKNQTLLTTTGLMVNIGLNSTTKFKKILAGHKTENECLGSTFFDGKLQWTNVVVEYIFILRITDFTALVSLSDDLININGTNCEYSKLECTDKYDVKNVWIENEISYIYRIWYKYLKFASGLPTIGQFQLYLLMISLKIIGFSILIAPAASGVAKFVVSA